MKHLAFILAMTLASASVFAAENVTESTSLTLPAQDITSELLSQYNNTKPLVVVAPKHFNGIELPVSNKKKLTVSVVKSTPNEFGDEAVDEWYEKYDDGCPYRSYWFGELRETDAFKHLFNMPQVVGNLWRSTVELHKDYNVFLYGEHKYEDKACGYDPYLAIITNPEVTRIERVIDFRSVVDAFMEKVMKNADGSFFSTFAIPEFSSVTIEGNIMYVNCSHRTYASSSKGKNAYIMAVNLETGIIKWMTKPLTCNSQFLVKDNSIICGYGFTDESHYVYVVDKNTGRRASRVVVKKSPELFSLKGNKLYSRMYAYDYIFNVK